MTQPASYFTSNPWNKTVSVDFLNKIFYFNTNPIIIANGFNAKLAPSASLAQAVQYNIPDPAGSIGAIAVAPAALVNGNLIQASGTAGLIADSGIAASAVVPNTTVLTDYQKFLTVPLAFSAGTWTLERISANNYGYHHTEAAETVVVAYNINEELRLAASKGFKLTAIDVVSGISTLAITSATPTLKSVTYVNNAAPSLTTITMTGSLSTGTQVNPYVDTLTISSPAFLNTAESKYVLEISYVLPATSVFYLYGINLKFSKTVA